jgi:hypothetical protein
LREEYSAAEMWQLLIRGRFTKPVRLASPLQTPVSSAWSETLNR